MGIINLIKEMEKEKIAIISAKERGVIPEIPDYIEEKFEKFENVKEYIGEIIDTERNYKTIESNLIKLRENNPDGIRTIDSTVKMFTDYAINVANALDAISKYFNGLPTLAGLHKDARDQAIYRIIDTSPVIEMGFKRIQNQLKVGIKKIYEALDKKIKEDAKTLIEANNNISEISNLYTAYANVSNIIKQRDYLEQPDEVLNFEVMRERSTLESENLLKKIDELKDLANDSLKSSYDHEKKRLDTFNMTLDISLIDSMNEHVFGEFGLSNFYDKIKHNITNDGLSTEVYSLIHEVESIIKNKSKYENITKVINKFPEIIFPELKFSNTNEFSVMHSLKFLLENFKTYYNRNKEADNLNFEGARLLNASNEKLLQGINQYTQDFIHFLRQVRVSDVQKAQNYGTELRKFIGSRMHKIPKALEEFCDFREQIGRTENIPDGYVFMRKPPSSNYQNLILARKEKYEKLIGYFKHHKRISEKDIKYVDNFFNTGELRRPDLSPMVIHTGTPFTYDTSPFHLILERLNYADNGLDKEDAGIISRKMGTKLM